MSTPQTSAPAQRAAISNSYPLGRAQISRPTDPHSTPVLAALAGPDSLDGHAGNELQAVPAVEGHSSPQARTPSAPIPGTPAGTSATAAAKDEPAAIDDPPLPFKTSQDAHFPAEAHSRHGVLVEDLPGDQWSCATHGAPAVGDPAQPTAIGHASTGRASLAVDNFPREVIGPTAPTLVAPLADQTPPLANGNAAPIKGSPGVDEAGSPTPVNPRRQTNLASLELADPLLALAADVLDDLESVRVANENRLRQLTRDEEDSDGEERGFGLTLDHPDVARLNALVVALADSEKAATKNLEKRLREHVLYPWLKRQKGVGDKQAARLLASIGDPYMRPELVREDGTVEPARPRTVSELWAYTGYHVVNFPVGHPVVENQTSTASGGKTGHPDHDMPGAPASRVGVAPKRARGQRANWSAMAKMRTYLIAESCMKQLKRTCPADEERGHATHADGCECSHYRKVYDAARQKYADAVHHTECVRCGPKGKPAQPGSPLSRKHQQARALRIVAKELLKDLWREARRIHLGEEETP